MMKTKVNFNYRKKYLDGLSVLLARNVTMDQLISSDRLEQLRQNVDSLIAKDFFSNPESMYIPINSTPEQIRAAIKESSLVTEMSLHWVSTDGVWDLGPPEPVTLDEISFDLLAFKEEIFSLISIDFKYSFLVDVDYDEQCITIQTNT